MIFFILLSKYVLHCTVRSCYSICNFSSQKSIYCLLTLYNHASCVSWTANQVTTQASIISTLVSFHITQLKSSVLSSTDVLTIVLPLVSVHCWVTTRSLALKCSTTRLIYCNTWMGRNVRAARFVCKTFYKFSNTWLSNNTMYYKTFPFEIIWPKN